MAIDNMKEMLKLLEPVLDATSDAICIHNRQGEKIFSNKAYENMIRRSKNEVICDSSEIIWDKQAIGTVEVYHDISEVNRLKRELDKVNQKLRKSQGKYTFQDIIGKDPDLQHMIRIARGAAATPATIMIRGESGTGKEIVAHAIHNSSSRRYENFVKVNCTSLPEELIESELFGYCDGAFTGARRGGKKGLFQEAHRGTLFLDEIGDISLRMQMKLLRVLQEKEIMPVGSTEVVKVDVRIICATNKNLEEMVEKREFRDDLYYRLNVFPLFIPPLRDRPDDIEDISWYLINHYNELYGRNVQEIEPAAIEILTEQKWKGNVRELENVLSRTMINMGEGEAVLKRSHLLATFGFGIGRNPAAAVPPQRSGGERGSASIAVRLSEALEEAERGCILSALDRTGGNKNSAAYELGIPLRTLYYKCNKLGLR
ncbi:MAG TPA: sigma 54-interacting transcriptional regulator [Anaerovoracaceae bacterium]|nr:sigma 54-interacting transcriptional regulator [Anaerovoracaceae bacterium]